MLTCYAMIVLCVTRCQMVSPNPDQKPSLNQMLGPAVYQILEYQPINTHLFMVVNKHMDTNLLHVKHNYLVFGTVT